MSTIGITRGEKTVSGALALGMHLLFALLLVFGVAWQKRTEAPVTVDLWSNLPPQPQPKVEPAPPEVKPEPEPPPPPPPKVVVPKAEPTPVPKPDIALKEKAEKERKRKEEERAEQERKRLEKEKAEAKKREEDKKRLAALKEAEARRREQEEAQRKVAQAQATAQQRLIDDYKRRISDRIRRYVVLPPNLQGNPEAEFDVVQIPGGEVLSVKLKRTSGNSAYDAAVERAIHKAQPLPPPPEGFTFGEFRELSLKFRPKE